MSKRRKGEPPDAFVWKDEYGIGIDAIDHDHQRLLATVDSALKRFGDDRNDEHIAATIADLEQAFDSHFRFEETLMESVSFPGLAAHRDKHHAFLAMLGELRQFHPGSADFNNDFLHAFRNWILYHIMVSDREIGRFLDAAT